MVHDQQHIPTHSHHNGIYGMHNGLYGMHNGLYGMHNGLYGMLNGLYGMHILYYISDFKVCYITGISNKKYMYTDM